MNKLTASLKAYKKCFNLRTAGLKPSPPKDQSVVDAGYVMWSGVYKSIKNRTRHGTMKKFPKGK